MSGEQDGLEAFTDWNDALTWVVHKLGGFKRVGIRLRPELETKAELAAQWLRDCLNHEKRERLNPDQVFLLLRLAREGGFHAAKFWQDVELGYEKGRPLDPKDELAVLQRQFIASVKEQSTITARIERLTQPSLQVVRP